MSTEWRTVLDVMLAALRGAQAERALRDYPTLTGEPRWVEFERGVMLAEVNDWRDVLGLPPVDEAAVALIEQRACGHCDYTQTYAIGCARLAMGMEMAEVLR